jgi:hypothetical protein
VTFQKGQSGNPGRQFQKGVAQNPGGRPKDIAEIKELARAHTVTALKTLIDVATKGKSEAARVSAATALLDRGWGRPSQPLANDPENPITAAVTAAERELEARNTVRAAFGKPLLTIKDIEHKPEDRSSLLPAPKLVQ